MELHSSSDIQCGLTIYIFCVKMVKQFKFTRVEAEFGGQESSGKELSSFFFFSDLIHSTKDVKFMEAL